MLFWRNVCGMERSGSFDARGGEKPGGATIQQRYPTTMNQWRRSFGGPGLVLLLFLACGHLAYGQSNFSFTFGVPSAYYDNGALNWGTSVGTTGKFNILPFVLLRAQFYVDRIQFRNVHVPDFIGTQTMTFICLGAGVEAAAGTRDFSLFGYVTPHGTIRTVSRILSDENGNQKIWILRRASMGAVFGLGFEAYVTDNIGFEMQAQYDIYNFDYTELDPIARALRSTIGVQFYLGRNFTR